VIKARYYGRSMENSSKLKKVKIYQRQKLFLARNDENIVQHFKISNIETLKF
jgi:hypothetical protein